MKKAAHDDSKPPAADHAPPADVVMAQLDASIEPLSVLLENLTATKEAVGHAATLRANAEGVASDTAAASKSLESLRAEIAAAKKDYADTQAAMAGRLKAEADAHTAALAAYQEKVEGDLLATQKAQEAAFKAREEEVHTREQAAQVSLRELNDQIRVLAREKADLTQAVTDLQASKESIRSELSAIRRTIPG